MNIEELAKLAELAKQYSIKSILEGSTHSKNVLYDYNQHLRLSKSISSLRLMRTNYIKNFNKLNIFNLDEGLPKPLLLFIQTVKITKKYSLGNCTEYALLALDYILNHSSEEITAEAYASKQQDHMIVIVGRKEGSDPKNPKTWGKQTYVCDPHINIISPYMEYKYKGKLAFCGEETFFYPVSNQNTTYIKETTAKHMETIKSLFYKKMQNILFYIKDFHQGACNLILSIKKQYGEKDHPYRIIMSKIGSIEKLISEMELSLTTEQSENNFFKLKDNLEDLLKHFTKKFNKIIAISEEENTLLYTVKKTFLSKFFPSSNCLSYAAIISRWNILIENYNQEIILGPNTSQQNTQIICK